MTLYFGRGSFHVTIAAEHLGIKSEGDIYVLPRFSGERQTSPEIIQTKGGLSLSSLNERNSTRTCIFFLWLQEEEKKFLWQERLHLSAAQNGCSTCVSLTEAAGNSPWRNGQSSGQVPAPGDFQGWTGQVPCTIWLTFKPALPGAECWTEICRVPCQPKSFHAFMKEALQELALQREVPQQNVFQTT